jgi:uncharacterized protein YneF (UPF0154 family)
MLCIGAKMAKTDNANILRVFILCLVVGFVVGKTVGFWMVFVLYRTSMADNSVMLSAKVKLYAVGMEAVEVQMTSRAVKNKGSAKKGNNFSE